MAANEEQIAYWNGPAGAKWALLHERIDAQLAPIGLVAMERLAPAAGERVLDVGCGCGATALALAERVGPTGRVTGVDVSGPMLARARERARERGVGTVTFVEGDASTHAFVPASIDAVFSRFGVMFFAEPPRAFANLRTAVVPGGRLGFVCWQGPLANEWVRVVLEVAATFLPLPAPSPPGAPGPFQLADRDWVRAVLGEAGWRDVSVDPHEAAMRVGGTGDLDEAVDFLQRIGPLARLLADVADQPDLRRAVSDALRARLADAHGPEGVRLGGAAWIVSARAPG
jgi:SAM-dependent methyltransferase